MSRSYSDEFKLQIKTEYLEGKISYRNLAKKYGVSKSFVWKLCLPEVRAIKIARGKKKLEKYRSERKLYAVGSKYDPT